MTGAVLGRKSSLAQMEDDIKFAVTGTATVQQVAQTLISLGWVHPTTGKDA